jgi:CubicO group peptidase (beta-lactamase class C family)
VGCHRDRFSCHFRCSVLIILALTATACQEDAGNLADQKFIQPISTLKTSVDNEEIISGLETGLPYLMDKAMIPGLSIAVIKDGETIWLKGLGVRNVATGSPVTEETVFEAASLSKPVYAYALLRLVDEGKLDLDEPLIEYVTDEYIEKNFLRSKIRDQRFRKITARMVLCHTTGFPNWRIKGELAICCEPGSKFGYSGEGFVYLQKVVEKITGMECNDFVSSYALKPLGMNDSSYVWRDDYKRLAAARHNHIGVLEGTLMAKRASAASSLMTTARDYAKFLIALMHGTGLKEETYNTMLSPQSYPSEKSGDPIAWGLGIGLQTTEDGTAFWHWGDNDNSKAFALAFKEQKIGVVYFANSYFGLSIVDEVVQRSVGGKQPALSSPFLSDYDRYDSAVLLLMRAYEEGGIAEFLEHYGILKRNPMSEKDKISEQMINRLAYALLSMKKYDDAISVFKLNVDAHPDSWNAYDSLAEAYMKSGRRDEAVANYRKSLELNPDNTGASEKVEELTR